MKSGEDVQLLITLQANATLTPPRTETGFFLPDMYTDVGSEQVNQKGLSREKKGQGLLDLCSD